MVGGYLSVLPLFPRVCRALCHRGAANQPAPLNVDIFSAHDEKWSDINGPA